VEDMTELPGGRLIRGIKEPRKLENVVPRRLEKISYRVTSSFVDDEWKFRLLA